MKTANRQKAIDQHKAELEHDLKLLQTVFEMLDKLKVTSPQSMKESVKEYIDYTKERIED